MEGECLRAMGTHNIGSSEALSNDVAGLYIVGRSPSPIGGKEAVSDPPLINCAEDYSSLLLTCKISKCY